MLRSAWGQRQLKGQPQLVAVGSPRGLQQALLGL